MRVKINDTWYDANDVPILIEMSDKDKENIANMAKGSNRYGVIPDYTMSVEEATKWVRE